MTEATVLDAPSARYDAIRNVDELVRAIDTLHCTPGWVRREQPLFWPAPRSTFLPVHWRYAQIRPALLAAGRVIGTDLAERRNFVLRNPVPGNHFATTRTLVGAYQSILPGERARSHRHSPHALRVILESHGSYSVVNGRQHPMESGDIVLTPGHHWHGHGHEGSEQAFWFDCLDLPLVHLLEPMRAEDHPQHWEPNAVREDHSPMRIEWADTQARLAALAGTPADAHVGRTLDVTSPLMPTITIKVHHWASGWRGGAFRHAANAIHVVLRGKGNTTVDEASFDWSFGDVFVAPLGARVRHTADEEAVVVSLSDEGLMRFCGFYSLEDVK
ncbi:cupin domain-containing protein [Hydrogenophaga sp. BPS33]|uniref:cupin domain-containing protein n=1 Tax=Hydrogenophaga sp. BPS33 TaxID=2651974 RepID=UPI00131FDA5F|nr:cupin domain-containing protein [Hydrogenophaga sp. BPS33]QHE86796.1 cupin domain-containing protein [Hydrogenophaga sp. BPS33]